MPQAAMAALIGSASPKRLDETMALMNFLRRWMKAARVT